ncbi:hypothetical protein HanPI659440_Chr11g0408551 [Helianthus annuus]|nr:hypothetical protein HanPI659440_Chr11g0408551 [Helianthus annuus]
MRIRFMKSKIGLNGSISDNFLSSTQQMLCLESKLDAFKEHYFKRIIISYSVNPINSKAKVGSEEDSLTSTP